VSKYDATPVYFCGLQVLLGGLQSMLNAWNVVCSFLFEVPF